MRKVELILVALAAASHALEIETKSDQEVIDNKSNATDHPDFENLSIQDRLKLMCSNESDFGNITEESCCSGKPGSTDWMTEENAQSDWKMAPKIRTRMNGDHRFRGRGGRSRRPRYRSYADYSAPSSYKGSDHDLSKGKFD